MKKILLLSTLVAGVLFISKPAAAQVSVSVNVGVQPAWGPAGYDYAENYYLPEVEAYYCVPRRQFVYFDAGNWVYASSLPARCGNYDLYSGYKVVINERSPWMHFNNHRAQYASFRYRRGQAVIRDRGYYGRPQYENRGWDRNRGDDRRDYDRGRGWDRDNDRSNRHDNGRWHNNDRDDRGRGRGRW